MTQTQRNSHRPTFFIPLIFGCYVLTAVSACSPKSDSQPTVWRGLLPENPYKLAPGIERVGSPGAFSASVFLIPGWDDDPFAPALKLPTTVVSQSLTEIHLQIAVTPSERLESIVEFVQPLSNLPTPARERPATEAVFDEYVFKPHQP